MICPPSSAIRRLQSVDGEHILEDGRDAGLRVGSGSEVLGRGGLARRGVQDGQQALGQGLGVVAALQNVDDFALAMLLGNARQACGQSVVAVRRQLEMGEGIMPVGVESGGDQQDVGLEALCQGENDLLADLGKRLVPRAGREGDIHNLGVPRAKP